MMRFNNEDERLAKASFSSASFSRFCKRELVRPRGVVVVQFVQFLFKYQGFCVSFLSRCQLSVGAHKKNEKTRARDLSPFWWRGRKEELFCVCVLFDERNEKLVSGSLFGCFAKRERERESGHKKHSNLSKKERVLIERTKRNVTTTRKRRKRKKKRRTKRFLRLL